MIDRELQTLPGFREFSPAEYLLQQYISQVWDSQAKRYAFARYEPPTVEPTELYRRKSGGELAGQLFHWEDQGNRAIALRPEITPSFARLAALEQRNYKKPFKWHQYGSCFRYEKPQRGRLREFTQWNCDIVGEDSAAVDAELMALALDTCRALGFSAEEIELRISDRRLWEEFLQQESIAPEHSNTFLSIIDQLEKAKPEVLEEQLQKLGTSLSTVENFIANPSSSAQQLLAPVIDELHARNLGEFVRIEPKIVRGLAYYSGVVFEIFDRKHNLRAIAGGGRYNGLISALTAGKVDLAAAGFGMGDAVINELISLTPQAKQRRDAWLSKQTLTDASIILAAPEKRPEALALAQQLRDHGFSIEVPLGNLKLNKQFQRAEDLKARAAFVVGAEYPKIQLKDLAARKEITVQADEVVGRLASLLQSPAHSIATDSSIPPNLG